MDKNKLSILNTDFMQLLYTWETQFTMDIMYVLLEPPTTYGYDVQIMLLKKSPGGKSRNNKLMSCFTKKS